MPSFIINAVPYAVTPEELASGVTMGGCDPARFQRMLKRIEQVSVIADEGGVDGICFSEQHFNIEGVPEVTTNPILLDAFVAGVTRRIRVGQLGVTLTANHPLRVAEDIALLDHISNGRAFCAFTRGNSKRWVNTLGLPFGTAATSSDKSENDSRNLRAVAEAWEIIRRAWTEDTFSYNGEFWQVPAPDTPWTYEITQRYGAGQGADGILREIGIAPRPLQQPFPRVYAPLASRMTTAKMWVAEGATAVCFAARDDFLSQAWDVLTESAEHRRYHTEAPVLAPGAHLLIGADAGEVAAVRAAHEKVFREVFNAPPYNVPMGRLLAGTPDEICVQLESLLSVVPYEEMFIWHNIGLYDERTEQHSIELFVDKVLPRFN